MNDLTLAIATATEQVSVALGSPGAPIASLHVNQGRRHGELLAPAIQTITRMTGISLGEIERIAVDVGPGLFTGLRVGVATAKALASALHVQVVPCSSLDLLAHPHRAAQLATASVVDARRGEVFWALYQSGAGAEDPAGQALTSLTEPSVSSPEYLAEILAQRARDSASLSVIVTGNGAHRYADLLRQVDGVRLTGPEHDHPSAEVLVELAGERASLPPEKVLPEYLRGADVRIGWEKRDE